MPSIDEVCVAAAAAVGGIDGLRAKGYADDQINPDEIQIYTRPYDPRMVFGRGADYGKTTYQLGARLFTSRQSARAAQKKLRNYMEPTGAGSVLAVLEDDANWSEDVDDVTVTDVGQPFEYEIQTDTGVIVAYWAVDWFFEVIW